MKILKELFESINKEAFKLKSVKEIYTKVLTLQELEDSHIDYISGFQIIDNNLRITILEGITGKAINLIKERLPKLELNTDKRKIFSNSKILFDKRIYSNFNLCLKFIKLRNPLTQILNTADIYLKANKYRDIFNAFMQLGFILQSPTFESITNAKLFPSYESLSQLERKYADIINDEDLTGVHTDKKKKSKLEKNIRTTNSANESAENKTDYVRNIINDSVGKNRSGSPSKNCNDKNILIMNNDNSSSPKKEKRNEKLNSYNQEFIKKKEIDISKSMQFSKKDNFLRIHNFNCDNINKISSKIKKTNKFWVYEKLTPLENIITSSQTTLSEGGNEPIKMEPYSYVYSLDSAKSDKKEMTIPNHKEENNKKEKEYYLYSQQKNNIYFNHLNEMRNQYNRDKDYFYTYSLDHLSLNFPIVEEKNIRYENYLENKKVKIYNLFILLNILALDY
jgi:hypothetical protein